MLTVAAAAQKPVWDATLAKLAARRSDQPDCSSPTHGELWLAEFVAKLEAWCTGSVDTSTPAPSLQLLTYRNKT